MAIGRTFEETLQKAIRSIDPGFIGFTKHEDIAVATEEELRNPSDLRLFAIADALHTGKFSVEKIWEMTRIDRWFLQKLQNIVNVDKSLW